MGVYNFVGGEYYVQINMSNEQRIQFQDISWSFLQHISHRLF